jgi:hypothetical protein
MRPSFSVSWKPISLSQAHGTTHRCVLQGAAGAGLQHLPTRDLPRAQLTLTPSALARPLAGTLRTPVGEDPHPFPFSNFKSFSLSFQSSFHLSLTVLVRYRSLADI